MSDRVSKPLYMKSPCKECPFRKDSYLGWLGKDRMTEIVNQESFPCHKTTNGKIEDRLQCAGHMILLRNNNLFYRLAMMIQPNFVLSGERLIFDNVQSCIDHHE